MTRQTTETQMTRPTAFWSVPIFTPTHKHSSSASFDLVMICIFFKSLEKKASSESPDSKESIGSRQSIIVSVYNDTRAQTLIQRCPFTFAWFVFNPIQSLEEEGSISEDASKKDDPPSSVDVAPPVGILADYPYCVTPQQMVRRPNSASHSSPHIRSV